MSISGIHRLLLIFSPIVTTLLTCFFALDSFALENSSTTREQVTSDLVYGGHSYGDWVIGQESRLDLWVINAGTITLQDVEVAFYWGDPQAGVQPLGSPKIIAQIVAGQSQSVQLLWIPTQLGQYTIYTWIDPNNKIAEINENNNSSQFIMTVREPTTDVALHYYSLQIANNLVAGSATTGSLLVTNSGELPLQNVAIRLYEGNPQQNGILIGATQAITEIMPQSNYLLHFGWQPSRAGTIDLYAAADPDNLLTELYETNNIVSRTVVVREPELDLVIPGYTLQINGELVEGREANGSVQIYNYGELAAQNVEVRFFEGDPAQGVQVGATQIITQIAANANSSLQFAWQPSQAGMVAFYAAIDSENRIIESNEANNVISRTVEIREANIAWYVNGSLTESGNGRTPETAFRTIGKAAEKAFSGDTIYVASGDYVESVSVEDGVSLLGQGYTTTKIRSANENESAIRLYHSTIISGFAIFGKTAEAGAPALSVWGGNVVIRNNQLTEASAGLTISCHLPNQKCTQPIEVTHNIIENNRYAGINIQNELTVTVRHNTVISNATGISLASLATTLVENNIVAFNSYIGIQNNGKNSEDSAQVRYNNVWGNRTQWGYEQNYIGLSAGPGSLSVDPMFRHVDTGDYRLLAGSPVIGKGYPVGVDMGALPFVPALPTPVGPTVDVDGEYRWLVRWNQQQAQGYNFYWGNHPHLYEQRLDMGNATAYILSHLRGGVTYYAAVSAYNSAGNESQLSAEISFYVPPLAQGTYEENHPALSWSGNWTSVADSRTSGGSYLRSNNSGDKFQMTFAGDTLVIYRNLFPEGGWAKLIIDGKVYGDLSFGFVEPRWQVPIILDKLGSGIHQLSLEVIEHPYLDPKLGTVTIDSIAFPSPFAPTSIQRQALERTNWHRAIAGLPLATGVQSIHQGAQGHAEFVANNKDHPSVAGLGFHQEAATLSGFIGRWPSDRARYFGYTGGLGEDGHFVGDPVGSVDGWMETIYHRNLIMCYGCIELGYGMVNDDRGRFDVLNMGSRTYSSPPERLIVAYPASGQTNLPTEWNGAEAPDPLPNKPKPVGYPISIHIVQPSLTAMTAANLDASSPFEFTQRLQRSSQWLITTAELRDTAKQIVPTYLLEQNTDPASYLGPDNAFLVAHKPLNENATYSVAFAGIDSQGKPFEKRWAFSTGGIVEAPNIQAQLWSEPAFPVNAPEIKFFIRLTNQSQYTAQQVRMTVGAPENATFIPNSAAATQGQVQQGVQLVLTLDDLPANATVELRYRVTTNSQSLTPFVIRSPVDITWHSGNLLREHVVIVNGQHIYLPLIAR